MATGLVVAGGYSARCGVVEKALLEVRGEPMLRRAVAALSPVVEDVVVDCRRDQVAPFERALADHPMNPRAAPTADHSVDPTAEPTSDSPVGPPADPTADVRFVVDDEPGRGPVAGLATGLSAVESAECVVLSCDRPGVTPDLLARLAAVRRRAGAEAAIPVVAGRAQPLCGVYDAAALRGAVRAAGRGGERRLCEVVRGLDRRDLSGPELARTLPPARLHSVDTPLEARLAG